MKTYSIKNSAKDHGLYTIILEYASTKALLVGREGKLAVLVKVRSLSGACSATSRMTGGYIRSRVKMYATAPAPPLPGLIQMIHPPAVKPGSVETLLFRTSCYATRQEIV